MSDFTALGDVVNTTARLAGAAAAGELLVSDRGGKSSRNGLAVYREHRTLSVRGKSDTVEVVALRSTTTPG